MTKLKLERGSSARGAQMGRGNEIPADYRGEKLRLTRLPFVDGSYDRWGAYWGAPANVWCAWGESATERVRIYVRANDREAAKAAVKARLYVHQTPSWHR